ncbi:MAG: DNA mismatch repair protein MutL, partial [Treponemataceae bacterium]|nr:DNA mismatch repair protein MutL [Treponemataceae bacterium]
PLTRPQEDPILRSVQRSHGTTVRVRALFETVPARKKFLKRPPAEAQLCYQVFCDKAMAFPEREFRFLQEGTLKTLLPATKGYKDRFSQILLSEGEKPFLHELYGVGEGFSVHILIGGPELYRSDRRNQFVFANHRRIQEYTLLHALEYGCQGFFPNGTHPVGALFIVIDPALVDFNIHPAKREVRFKDPAVIHHTITRTLQEFFGRHVLYVQTYETTENREPLRENFLLETNFPPQQDNRIPFSPAYSSFPREEHLQSSPYRRSLGEENALAFGIAETTGPLGITEGSEQIQNHPSFFVPFPRKDRDEIVLPGEGFLYLGQLFNLFLIVEKNNALYLIDQH